MDYDDQNIFAKILRGEIPTDPVFENDHVLAFRDIAPHAPVHLLVIPKAPIINLGHAAAGDAEVLGQLLVAVGEIARREGWADDGFRVVVNNGARANQTVFHLHLHVLAGRDMRWPPG